MKRSTAEFCVKARLRSHAVDGSRTSSITPGPVPPSLYWVTWPRGLPLLFECSLSFECIVRSPCSHEFGPSNTEDLLGFSRHRVPASVRSIMASADFSSTFLGIAASVTCSQAVKEISQGKTVLFRKIMPNLPGRSPGRLWGVPSGCRVTPNVRPCIGFLFVMTLFCLQLPSDSTSRWTPLPQLAVPISTARRGLDSDDFSSNSHLLENCHAWHTTRASPAV